MPVQVSYPGVYIEEIPSSPTTVTSATTSATAFADFFLRGPVGEAVMVTNFSDFQRTFGGLSPKSEASYAISQYFNNGGQIAWVTRLGDGSAKTAQIAGGVPVTVPTFDSLLQQAQSAAAAATAAATQANNLLQSDLAKESTEGTAADVQAALDVAAQTQLAAEATRQAAAAAQVAGLELQQDLEAATPDVAARDAAINAALAADKAQQAAQQAATAVANASTASSSLNATPKPTAPAAAQTAAGAGISATATAATKQVSDLGKVTTDGSNAATASAQGAAGTKKALNAVNTATTQAISAATALSTAATQTQSQFNSLTKNGSLTVTTAPEIQALGGQVASLVQLAQSSVTACEALVAAANAANTQATADTKVTDKTAFGSLVTDSQASLNDALAASQAANQAEAAMAPWIAAANESQNENDSAVANAAATAANDANTTYQAMLALQNTATAYNADSANSAKKLSDALMNAIIAAVTAAQIAVTSTQAVVTSGASTTNTAQATTDTATALAKLYKTGDNTTVWGAATATGSNATTDLLTQIITAVAAAQTATLDASVTQDLYGTTAIFDNANQAVLDAMTAAAAAAGAAATAALQAALAMQEGQAGQGTGQNILYIDASNPGAWGNAVQVAITVKPGYKFDLTAQEMAVRNGQLKAVNTETYRNLNLSSEHDANYAPKVVASESQLIRLRYSGLVVEGACPKPQSANPMTLGGGTNGNPPKASDLFPALTNALNNIAPSTFNILCLPVIANYSASEASTANTNAQNLAASAHAFYIVDIPASVDSTSKMQTWMGSYGNAAAINAAVYYPRLLMPDPLQNYRLKNVGASGTLAGIYSKNDLSYGVWETPAGINAVLENAQIAGKLTDADNGVLNQLGVNCLRTFPVYGNVVWGGRTMAGADQIGSEWKYINVRRLADYIEQSLLASLRWVVFQNNDPRLWSQIRQQVGSFMSGLYAAGAFAGGSADQAYVVKCDSTTTTQTDIDNGIVNILVGFAPEKPAEFVVISIEQLAGQTAS